MLTKFNKIRFLIFVFFVFSCGTIKEYRDGTKFIENILLENWRNKKINYKEYTLEKREVTLDGESIFNHPMWLNKLKKHSIDKEFIFKEKNFSLFICNGNKKSLKYDIQGRFAL